MAGRNEVDSNSSSDDEEDEGQKQMWTKIEKVLEEYHLSPFALVAAKKWVKLMANSKNSLLPGPDQPHAQIATGKGSCHSQALQCGLGVEEQGIYVACVSVLMLCCFGRGQQVPRQGEGLAAAQDQFPLACQAPL